MFVYLHDVVLASSRIVINMNKSNKQMNIKWYANEYNITILHDGGCNLQPVNTRKLGNRNLGISRDTYYGYLYCSNFVHIGL